MGDAEDKEGGGGGKGRGAEGKDDEAQVV